MKVCLLTTQASFIRGGAEVQTECLQSELVKRGIESEVVALPFSGAPARDLKACIDFALSLNILESCGVPIDRIIGLKFPSYLVPHPNKVMWIMHQHRAFYDLWDHSDYEDYRTFPEMVEQRARVHQLDRELIPQAKHVFCTSKNVAARLEHYSGVVAQQMYPPPQNYEAFRSGEFGDYLYFPSRLGTLKRQELAIRALAKTRSRAKLIFSGEADVPAYFQQLRELAEKLGVGDRVRWMGYVSLQEKITLYSNCRGVLFVPVDEDMGYITMEAFLSSKPVITCTDSGGPLEFMIPGLNGFVAEPTENALGEAIDQLWGAPVSKLTQMGHDGLTSYQNKDISWDRIIEKLIYSK